MLLQWYKNRLIYVTERYTCVEHRQRHWHFTVWEVISQQPLELLPKDGLKIKWQTIRNKNPYNPLWGLIIYIFKIESMIHDLKQQLQSFMVHMDTFVSYHLVWPKILIRTRLVWNILEHVLRMVEPIFFSANFNVTGLEGRRSMNSCSESSACASTSQIQNQSQLSSVKSL